MLGRPASCDPVWQNVIAGSWLIASVNIDLMKHKSSACCERCGHNSLMSCPLRPYFWNLNNDGATGNAFCPDVIVVNRCPCRMDSGSSCARYFSSCGL